MGRQDLKTDKIILQKISQLKTLTLSPLWVASFLWGQTTGRRVVLIFQEALFNRFIDSFGILTAAWHPWQGFNCASSGLKWKKNLCPWILRWNCNHGNILTRNIWMNLVGLWELSVQPWYFIMTVNNRGSDNGSICVKCGKKKTQEGSDPQWQ